LARGPPSEIVQMAEDRLVQVFASLEMLDEINRVLQYEKITGILNRSRTRSSTVMGTIARLSSIVDVKKKVRVMEEDPSDNHALACAKEVAAQFIVSGDRHLLTIGRYGTTRIISASEFLQIRRAHKTRKEMRAGAQGFLKLRKVVSRRWAGHPSVLEETRRSRHHKTA
jgi:putative PIN family toxin of toxin-antitoxin system